MIRFAKYFVIYLVLVSCGFQSIYVSNKSNFSFNKSNALGEIKLSKEIISNLSGLKRDDGEYELIIETIFKKNVSSKNKKGKFSNKKLMFTGGFKKMSRSEAKAIAENNGGKVLGSISKKLDFLIVGDTKPTKRKIEQAKELNIKIILEKDWDKILNS